MLPGRVGLNLRLMRTAWQAALRRDGDVEIFGECVRAGRRANVRISSLDCDGCEVSAELPPGCEIALWIGAIGPFVADAVQHQAGHVCVRFKEPIDRRIVDHFEVA